jgi:lysozyme
MNALGPNGTKLIQRFEALVLVAYKDQKGVWTIGWGHTPAVEGQTCTEWQASQWFIADTQTAVNCINRSVDVALNQNQFDALVSWCFNVGQGNAAGSTLIHVLNMGNYLEAADQLLVWNHCGGQIDPGLTRRRNAEHDLFLLPIA